MHSIRIYFIAKVHRVEYNVVRGFHAILGIHGEVHSNVHCGVVPDLPIDQNQNQNPIFAMAKIPSSCFQWKIYEFINGIIGFQLDITNLIDGLLEHHCIIFSLLTRQIAFQNQLFHMILLFTQKILQMQDNNWLKDENFPCFPAMS